jgi:hypothetical protein
MTHIHGVVRQNKLEIPNDEEEVNTREIHKCDGQAHDPDTMVAPLTPKPTEKPKPSPKVSLFIFSRIKKRRGPKVKLVTLLLCEVKKSRSSFYEKILTCVA